MKIIISKRNMKKSMSVKPNEVTTIDYQGFHLAFTNTSQELKYLKIGA